MLEEKVEELKNKKQKSLPVKIELELSYVVDEGYFLSEQDKLQFYREIENVENLEELEEVEEQMIQKTS
jgi:transcription-repair coupling factor (superfamily II helicase)